MKVTLLTAVISVLAIFVFSQQREGSAGGPSHSAPVASSPNCSDGWRITGYYTPIETDFTTPDTREIEVRGPDHTVTKETFNADFLRTIFDDDKGYGEGWGKTRFGWYLGNYNGGWHKAEAPLDADDKPLQPDAVAVDRSVIPAGSIVRIPELPGDLGKLTFKSTDVGVSVHGKHVDVYTGEGREARRRMYLFTYEDEDESDKGLTRVCFQSPTTQQ